MYRGMSVPLHLEEADLTGPVRRLLESESAMLTDWQVSPLAGGRGEITGGVYRVAGHGHDQGRPVSWSLVLKVVRDPGGDDDPGANNYWKREFLTYQAGLLSALPGIGAPRCIGVRDSPGECTWLWLEDIGDMTGTPWSVQDYAEAARRLAHFNAAYLQERPLPEGLWLSERMLRKWCAFFAPYVDRLPQTLEHPLVRRICSPAHAHSLARLWAAHALLLEAVERLPQTFCHFDAIGRNLYRRASAETVALDWEWAGLGAVGEELAPLVAGSLCMGDAPAMDAERLDAAAFAAYEDGLHEAGWRGDMTQLRLAYTAASALRYGLWIAWLAGMLALEEDGHTTVTTFFDRPVDAVVEQFACLAPLLIAHVDEAQALL